MITETKILKVEGINFFIEIEDGFVSLRDFHGSNQDMNLSTVDNLILLLTEARAQIAGHIRYSGGRS